MTDRKNIPVTRGEVWPGVVVLDGPFYWREDDSDVWHKLLMQKDPDNDFYVITETATGTSIPL